MVPIPEGVEREDGEPKDEEIYNGMRGSGDLDLKQKAKEIFEKIKKKNSGGDDELRG